MPRKKRTPMRTCVACRTQRPKRELLRIVRTPAREVQLDPSGKAAGRGAYVCLSADCVRRSRQRKSLAHSLKCEIPNSFWSDLEHHVAQLAPVPEQVDPADRIVAASFEAGAMN